MPLLLTPVIALLLALATQPGCTCSASSEHGRLKTLTQVKEDQIADQCKRRHEPEQYGE
jgi:hypothetical protein